MQISQFDSSRAIRSAMTVNDHKELIRLKEEEEGGEVGFRSHEEQTFIDRGNAIHTDSLSVETFARETSGLDITEGGRDILSR